MAAKARNPQKTRNPDLIRGVGKFSRSKMYHKRGLWAIKAKNGGVFPHHDPKVAAEAPVQKAPKFYPAEDVKKPLVNKHKPKPTKLSKYHSRDSLDHLGWKVQGEESCLSQAAFLWVALGHWTIQAQWSSHQTCESSLRDRNLHQG
uniref:Large ribosomal subunit protein uL6 N-terminal domain-containing protein n=1 Tax=Cannabis sativa TaxID=3483 RepID=A0A803R9Y3_CANSA